MARPSYMVVDLAALIANYQWARQLAPQAQTMAVVKANACLLYTSPSPRDRG